MLTAVSSAGHGETVSRLLEALARRGVAVFTQIDHSAAARQVGLEMPAEVVVVFGNPRAGTPLMQADPRIGIELPLRMLVWDQDGQTMVGYNDPKDLAGPYDVTAQAGTLEAMSSLLNALAGEATGRLPQ